MAELKIVNLKINRGAFFLNVPDVTVEQGKVLGVMGKSGAGKSTFLQAIAGFESIDSGEIRVDGKDISKLPIEKRKVAIVFQRPALFSHLKIIDNVCFGLKIQKLSREEQLAKANYWLNRLRLQHLADRWPHEISGGEAQRVALIRSVIVGFSVLLLDEPFSALDKESKSECRSAVRDVVDELGLATIIVSHDQDDINYVADDCCQMQLGKITGLREIKR